MRKKDMDNFDFIKNKFDAEKPELPQSLSTEAIRAKLEAGDAPKVIKLHKKNNFFAIAAAAAVFIIVVGAVLLFGFGSSNDDKIENFDPYISESDRISGFSSYDELNSTIDSLYKIEQGEGYGAGIFLSELDYREEGVEKPDIIKTDGKYIYYAYKFPWGSNEDRIYIFKASGDKTNLVSIINPLADSVFSEDDRFEISGLFISGNSLAVIMEKRIAYEFQYGRDLNTTITKIYDVKTKTDPVLVTEFEQSGKAFTSRMVNGILYIASNYEVAGDDKEYAIPSIRQGDALMTVSPNEIYSFETAEYAQYAVISSIDLQTGKPAMPLKAVLGGSAKIHCTKSYMYVNEYINGELEGDPEREIETAMKLDLRNGYIAYATDDEVNKYSHKTVDLGRDGAYESTLHQADEYWINIGQRLDDFERDITLYDKDLNELDRKIMNDCMFVDTIPANEKGDVYALPIYPSGFITFEIRNDSIVITNEIEEAGEEGLVFIGDRIYSISVIDDDAPEEERLQVFSYKY